MIRDKPLLSLFRGITCGGLPYLPPVPQAPSTSSGAAVVELVETTRPYLGLPRYHPSGVVLAGIPSLATLATEWCGILQHFPFSAALPFTFFYYPGLRPPVAGYAFFSSSLGRVQASFSLRSFFRQIYIEGELPSARAAGGHTSHRTSPHCVRSYEDITPPG